MRESCNFHITGKAFSGLQRRPASAVSRLVRRFCRDQSGVSAILMALLLPMILGMMGLSVDVGVWYLEKRGLQTMADAAALAGGSELANGSSTAIINSVATAGATRNEFDSSSDSITINNPPLSGPNTGNSGSIEIIISRQMPLFFTAAFFKLVGSATEQFNATARAVVNTEFVEEFCILGLDTTATRAVDVTGTATLDCGIAVNSSAGNALNIGGNGVVTVTSVSTVGDVNINGGGILDSDAAPRSGTTIDDPYSDLEIPPFAAGECDAGSLGGGDTGTTVTGVETINASDFGGVMTLCGGLTVNAGGILTLGPGVYIIDQGDFKINGGGSVFGEGVTIILTSSGADNKIGNVAVNGGADIELSAPTDDPAGAPGYSGVLFYQDRNVSSSSSKSNFFNGGAELNLEGALYFPEQSLDFSGGADVGDGCTQLVAKTVSIAGEANLETNCNDAGTRAIGRFKAVLGE